jgi:hypothetical protein
MHVSSRFAALPVFALAILITLGGIGAPTLQAQDQSEGQSCPQPCPQACPVKPSCQVKVPDCQVPRLQKPCAAPQCETCCPVDPKEVKKAQKSADHAAHEAAEACRRQKQTAAKAQKKVDEATDHWNHEIDEASARFETRRGEYEEALTKSANLNAQQQEQQAATVECPATVERAKPEPIPSTPAPIEETPSVTPPPALTPAPAPAPEPAPPISEEVKPKELPKTASPLELIGLVGLTSSLTGCMTRFFRG